MVAAFLKQMIFSENKYVENMNKRENAFNRNEK